jgi:phage baseplate assembly protein W
MKPRYPAHLSFPFRIGPGGRTAVVADINDHVRDEIIQLILTALGERLFLPQFGTNVRRLVFENLDDAVGGLTKATIAQALSEWLGDRVHADDLQVTVDGSTITVDLSYRVAGGDTHTMRFQRTLG